MGPPVAPIRSRSEHRTRAPNHHISIMKCLLVFAVALVAVRADEMMKAEVKPVLTYAHAQPLAYPVAHPYYTPVVYNTHHVVAPVVHQKEHVVEYQPEVTKYVAKPYDVEVKVQEPELVKTACKNFLGFHVPCKQKRDTVAVTNAVQHVVPTVYTHVPQVHYPVTYHAPTVVKYKALPTKVHEIEVPTPQLKKVVEKVPVQPLCTNNFGLPVPCVHNA